MSAQQTTITTRDNVELFATIWMPEGTPKAMIALSHGGGEHIDRYHYVAAKLNAAGYGVVMADLRGHGRSPGKRGHIDSWQGYQNDLYAMLETARAQAPAVPLFLGGHSLGGLNALSIAVTNPEGVRGVFVSGPYLVNAIDMPGILITASKVLSVIAPGLQFSNQIPVENVSRDEAIVAAYDTDQYVHDRVSARAASEILNAQQAAFAAAPNLTLPLFVQHGTADKLAEPGGSRQFYEAAGSTDKQRIEYDGLYHEIYNEPEKDEVLAALISWLDTHI